LLIGRHADGAGRLAEDDEISRSHARISLDRSGFCAIEDLGSTNGTFVNGLRITAPHTLSVGDTIEVGGTTLVVRELPIAATERPLKAVPPKPTTAPRGVVSERAPSNQDTPRTGARGAGMVPRTPTEAPPPTSDEPQTASAPPNQTSVRLQIDFVARRATVALEGGSAPLRLEFDGEGWRPAAS
jgi:pSer/pThr/pTyr-binding forkhead associated (FHA) protein